MAVGQLKLQLKKIHKRICRNRLTAIFFLFAFFHCFAQGIIQSLLFTIDAQYSSLLDDISHAAQINPRNHTDLIHVSGGFTVAMCDYLPHSKGNCSIIFDSTQALPLNTSDVNQDAQLRGELITFVLENRQPFHIFPGQQQVTFNSSEGQFVMSESCTNTLLYPSQHMDNNKREDIAFVLLQFWLFGISFIAMMYDSVPHVLTVFITRILLTAWSIYSLWRTGNQQAVFEQMIETPGTPCSVAMFGSYFSTRILYEIPDLILNCTALGISAYLSWTLFQTYNSEAFTCVGAPKAITNMYKYFLALQVCVQLEVFVLSTAAGLWADQLFNTYIHTIAVPEHTRVYEGIILCYAILIGPWLLIAWYGIRFEKRVVAIIFIMAGCVFFAASSLMFISPVYRWTYYAWPCISCFITASLVLLPASIVLGLICLKNFGKGLSQYLYAEANLSSSNFASEVFERDVESTYIDDEKLKASGLHADFTTHYLPNLPMGPSRDSFLSG
jgi:hypothetical protein